MTLLTNRTSEPIPGYRVVQRIGAGGYGEVWTANAPGDLLKAIKFVYGLLDEDRATRELKALNRVKGVRHPFLLSLERIEIVDGQLLIVTELADCSLKDRFEECRKQGLPGIPREELLRHLRDTADALDFMSDEHSLQHLDVKPENLLLLGGRIKVADFGLVKDIKDHTASMMGGLTPVYAPPEVFEGRPGRRSDQYSLAIVYQEMLTGVLPFPGRTAAQLAAQHLNARPKLAALPEADQGPVGRALSKKPDERFVRCSDLVDALEAAVKTGGRSTTAKSAATAGQATSSGATQAQPRTPGEMLADLDAASRSIESAATGVLGEPTRPGAHAPAPVKRATLSPAEASALLREASAKGASGAPPLAELETALPLVDLPPVEADLSPPVLRPTLFIGLGGCGGKVLRRLRRRLDDRLSTSNRGLLSMLLLDTDVRDLTACTYGDDAGRLRPEETISLPLRRSQDYRNDSRRLLQWLSRRWLFNIPRSQQTEGLRPLGRLALADHATEVLDKLRQALTALRDRAARTGAPPRVILCGSLCGGTCGGVLADLALAVRQVQDELNSSGGELLAVLSFGTNRNPQQQELATANGLAALTELAHFHRPGVPFPGDPDCGLKERAADSAGLDAAYVVHTGADLSPQQWEAACDRMAEFLLLDALTPVSHALRAARQESQDLPGLQVRSFGLYQLGFGHDTLVDAAVRGVCRETISRWNGPTQRHDVRQTRRLLPSAASAAPAPAAGAASLAEIDQLAAQQAQALGLDVEPLVQGVAQLATTELGGDATAFFQNLLAGLSPPHEPPPLAKWLTAANDLFGRAVPDDTTQHQPGELSQALDPRIGPCVAQLGASLRQAVEQFIDQPSARLLGARRAAKWFQNHLKSLVDRLSETRARMVQERWAFEQALDPGQLDPRRKSKGPRRTPAELAALFLQYCSLRLFELSAQRAGQVAHALQSHAVGAHDALVDLSRDLDHLASQFPADETVTCSASSTSFEFCSIRETVAEKLQQAEEGLARQIDEQITASVFAVQGGLRKVIGAGGEARELLLTLLQTTVRQAVLAQLQTIDLASLLLAENGAESPLHKAVADAQPWLQRCGGKRRLLCVMPEQMSRQYDAATLGAQLGPEVFGQSPAIVPDASSDLVLLYELGDLSLPHVAGHLIDFRPDLLDAANRLHTRSDITWSPLVS